MAQAIISGQEGVSSLWAETRRLSNMARRRTLDYLAYRRTARELSQLSEHVLADLGLHRSEIRQVAYDSVYGARR